MKGLRLLNNGEWSKPPVLTAARRILVHGLSQHYPLCPLGETASFLNGTSYDVGLVSDLGQSPIIRISNITDPASKYIRTQEDLGSTFWVRHGDLLVSWSASFKSTIWTGLEGYLNQHIFKVTEKPGFHRNYIRHAIEASFDKMQENVVGIGMMHLRRPDFLGYEIPAPPLGVQGAVATFLDWIEKGYNGKEPLLPSGLAQQRRIVARIKELSAKIEEARRLRKQATEAAEALVQNAVEGVMGDGWPVVPLQEAVDSERPITYGIVQAGDHIPDGVPYIRVSDMAKPRLTTVGMLRTAPEIAARYRRSAVRAGDIVFAIRATVGKMRFVPQELDGANLTQGTARIAPSNKATAPYLFWALQSRKVAETIQNATKGSTFREITLGRLRTIPIPLPTIQNQDRIVARLEELQAKADALKTLQAETSAELDALMPSILDKAFRGEL